jgi:hypothetical protein
METRSTAANAPAPPIDWGKALVAGLVATVVITVTMALFGQNILKMLGGMIAPGAGSGTQYLIGGVMHLAVGLIYGLLYAWLLGPVLARGPVAKGLLYGAALTGIALAMMPAMTAMMGGGAAAANPCNPCASPAATNPCNPCADYGAAANPCNPCAQHGAAANPCNPCAEHGAAPNPCNPCAEHGAAANPCNPCNPCGDEVANPCNPCSGGAANACNPCAAGNPCNPCGGGGSPWSGVISLLNHVFYGLALALVYGRR